VALVEEIMAAPNMNGTISQNVVDVLDFMLKMLLRDLVLLSVNSLEEIVERYFHKFAVRLSVVEHLLLLSQRALLFTIFEFVEFQLYTQNTNEANHHIIVHKLNVPDCLRRVLCWKLYQDTALHVSCSRFPFIVSSCDDDDTLLDLVYGTMYALPEFRHMHSQL